MLIVKLNCAQTIHLSNALRAYAEQLKHDAGTYTRHGSMLAASDAHQTAELMSHTAEQIDCGPAEIHLVES